MDEMSFLTSGTKILVEEKTQVTILWWNKIYNIDTYNVPLQKEEDNFVNGDTEWDIEGKGNI